MPIPKQMACVINNLNETSQCLSFDPELSKSLNFFFFQFAHEIIDFLGTGLGFLEARSG